MQPLLGAVLALSFSVLAAVQQPATSPPAASAAEPDAAAVPVDQEPRHHLVFANEFVRIIDALFPGFYVSQNHTHAADHVTVVIVAGRDDAQGQARVGFAGFAKGGYSHVVTNPAPGPMRFIDVELRAPDRGTGGDDAQSGHFTVLNNTRVRIVRVKIDPGQSVTEHRHVNGYVSVTVRGGEGAGTWKWHPAGEPAATLESGRQALDVVEITPK
jgi:hypothetical protein